MSSSPRPAYALLAPLLLPGWRTAAGPHLSAVTTLTASHAIYALLQWLVLLAVARRLGATATGDLALALSITAPIFVLAALQLRLLMVTDGHLEERLGAYLRLRAWTGLLAVLVSAGAGLALIGANRAWLVCCTLALCKLVELWSDAASALYQRLGMLRRLLLSQSARGALALGAILLAAAFGGDLLAGVLLWLGLWSALALLVDAGVLARATRAANLSIASTPARDVDFIRSTLVAGASLSVAAFLNSLAAGLPRLWLARHASMDVLGEFALVAYVLAAVSVLLSAATIGLAPAFSLDGQAARGRPILLAMGAAGVVGTAAALLAAWQAPQLVEVSVGAAFRGSTDLLRIAVWALPFYGVSAVANTVAAAQRRGKQQIVPYLATLATIVAVLWLDRSGAPARIAAHALVAGSVVQAVLLVLALDLRQERVAR